jgi:DNA-binding transcriptional LysR family regulator
MIGAAHPSREALKRDPQTTLRTLPLITSYLRDATRQPDGNRLRNSFGAIWEVSHMELRLALAAEGKGATYVSDLLSPVPSGLVPIEGLPFSSIERQVGLYYLKHQPLSQAGSRFLALCRSRWDAPDPTPSSVDLLKTPEK